MSKTLKRSLKIILPLAVGVFLVWYSLSSMTKEHQQQVVYHIKNANYWWVALSLFCGVLSHFSRAYRWNFLLEPIGYKPKFANNVMTVLIAYFANLGIPRSGEVFRATAISAYEDIPFEKAFGTIVVERVIDLIMLLLVVALAFLFQAEILLEILKENNFNPTYLIIFLIAGIAGLAIFVRLIRRSTSSIVIKIRGFLSGLLDGLSSIVKMKKRSAFVFHTLFIWSMYIAMFYVIKFSISGIDELSIGTILCGFIAGAFAMTTTNGGIGVYPIAVSGIFVAFGVNADSADAFGWIMWTAQTAMVIVFGALAFFFLPIYNRKKA
ncbi:YbhN family protein [Sungkyunkwania multivorans]|uniref:YbhN family protein n=1 Tax=Sungkyunkwania multivorans TaxID=1173618 RepID=A0ABW3D070_9FLAO